ncbi:hypothetical protein HanXRQr2_Chr05g0206871 [Helianthus annuus]|uniref:Uncharacterized protein n=1 Tax=Helianthus annuus TaxID=4232 RepID=A0A9K3NN20_HELAN|nr:hypothetical protein HanXRQr2_Chr05g0206871 [Helianthus annuus]
MSSNTHLVYKTSFCPVFRFRYVTVSPTSGNFVPKFNQRKLVRARNMKSER